MKLSQLTVTAAILAAYGSGSQLLADGQADDINKLKRDNETLQQRVKTLEEQLNQKFKALEDQLNQKSNIATTELPPPKLPESNSLFKVPSWISSIRLVNDLRMRYDEIYAPDSDFVTRWRMRPRLRLGAIVGVKDDWEIGFRITSTPSV